MAVQKLKLHNDDSVRLDSVLLLEKVTKQDRAYIYAHPEIKLSAQEVTLLDKLLKRRVVGEPMAYILGNKEFYGREFTVTKDVLIPRPDSENIIELLKLNTAIDTSFKLLDVGTGSGCLAITAKLERPNINVYACDISNNALKVAKENAKTLEADITFNESDLFANTPGKFDIILANLPYIPNEFDVSDDVKSEPALALYSGNDGLYLTTKFFEHVIGKLNAGGFIIMESLQIQHKKINQLAEAAGLKLIETKDLVQLYKLK
jgi:release factor glutamine methyltransferase